MFEPGELDEMFSITEERFSMFGSGITAGTAGGPNWEAEVDKGRIEMKNLNAAMNGRDANGYALHFIYEQAGNSVVIWRRVR